MYQQSRFNSDLNFFQKVKNLDFVLLLCIIILSVLSFFIMYSTDGGEFLYHTKNHLTKLIALSKVIKSFCKVNRPTEIILRTFLEKIL